MRKTCTYIYIKITWEKSIYNEWPCLVTSGANHLQNFFSISIITKEILQLVSSPHYQEVKLGKLPFMPFCQYTWWEFLCQKIFFLFWASETISFWMRYLVKLTYLPNMFMLHMLLMHSKKFALSTHYSRCKKPTRQDKWMLKWLLQHR